MKSGTLSLKFHRIEKKKKVNSNDILYAVFDFIYKYRNERRRISYGPIRPRSGPRVDQDRTRRALSDGLFIFLSGPFHHSEKPEILPENQ